MSLQTQTNDDNETITTTDDEGGDPIDLIIQMIKLTIYPIFDMRVKRYGLEFETISPYAITIEKPKWLTWAYSDTYEDEEERIAYKELIKKMCVYLDAQNPDQLDEDIEALIDLEYEFFKVRSKLIQQQFSP
jgi:hypothetical protein